MIRPLPTEVEINVIEIDVADLDDVEDEALVEQDAKRTARRAKRRVLKGLAGGLVLGVAAVLAGGIVLTATTGTCAGATISGHVRKMEHRTDGFVLMEGDEAIEADEPAEPVGP